MSGTASKVVDAWLLFGAVTAAALADTASLLDEVVAAHGGGVAPPAIRERGVTESLRRGAGPVERWWQASDRFRIDIRYPGAEESRLLRGAPVWQQGKPGSAPLQAVVVLQAARMALPWRLKENSATVLDLGAERNAEGRPVRAALPSFPLKT